MFGPSPFLQSPCLLTMKILANCKWAGTYGIILACLMGYVRNPLDAIIEFYQYRCKSGRTKLALTKTNGTERATYINNTGVFWRYGNKNGCQNTLKIGNGPLWNTFETFDQ